MLRLAAECAVMGIMILGAGGGHAWGRRRHCEVQPGPKECMVKSSRSIVSVTVIADMSTTTSDKVKESNCSPKTGDCSL